jgi:hypothetical protein
MRRLQALVAQLHEHGPWASDWVADEAFAQGPDNGDETVALVADAIKAIELLP